MKLNRSHSKNKLAVVYIAHDGITSHYAGIGTYSMCYLYSLPKITRELSKYDSGFDIYLITPKYKKSFYGYKQSVKILSHKTCKENGGYVVEVDNGMNGLDSYGDVENWDLASKNAADEISYIADNYKRLIVVAVDTPFLRLGEFMAENYPKQLDKMIVILSPQSTELIHKTGNKPRLNWERERFRNVNNYQNIKVSYSSLYLKSHLSKDYKVSSKSLVSSMSGIIFISPRYKKLSKSRIRRILIDRGLPLDRPIVFSVGRLEPYKGFEDTMKLFRCLDRNLKSYLVLVGISYIPNNPFLGHLHKLKEEWKIEGKFIFNLDLELPIALWQWSNCLISAHISQYEPFGLAPVEARYLASSGGPVVVVSDRGGLKEQIVNGKEGFIVKYGDTDDYRRVVKQISRMTVQQKNEMRQMAYNNVVSKYDAYKNIFSLLSSVDPSIYKIWHQK